MRRAAEPAEILHACRPDDGAFESCKGPACKSLCGRRGARVYAVRKELLGENLGRALLDKNLCLFIDEQGAAREAASFSAGTLDALTLCMRLALVDALFTKEQPFLLLDDPFVNLDDARTKRALELLQKISQQRQVVYLVCNSARV